MAHDKQLAACRHARALTFFMFLPLPEACTSKTIIVLALLSSVSIFASAQTSPRNVLARFCELDSQGKQSTSDGWQEIAALFVAPAAPRLGKITVVKDFVVSRPALEGKRAEFYVEYIEYGHIDPFRARFSDFLTIKARSGLVLQRCGVVRQNF